MSAYRKNHIATKAYLRGWVDENGLLVQVPLTADRDEQRLPPEVVGSRSRFFRHPAVAASAEKTMGRYESRAISVLRGIDDLWPLAGLLAIHIYRSPSGRGRISEISTAELARRRDEYGATMTRAQLETFHAAVRHERFEVQYILETIPKTAALIASAHWSLVKFGRPLLATGDQPITVIRSPTTGPRPSRRSRPPACSAPRSSGWRSIPRRRWCAPGWTDPTGAADTRRRRDRRPAQPRGDRPG